MEEALLPDQLFPGLFPPAGPARPQPDARRVFGPYVSGRGEEVQYADPFRVARRLRQLLGGEGGAAALTRAWASPLPSEALPASERLLAAVADAFEVQRFDKKTGLGANEDELLGIWNAWVAWSGQKKTTVAPSPTFCPPSAGPPVPPWAMPRSSASASTPTVPNGVGAGPSPGG